MGYIYKITNLINNKIYIGKTERTIQQRWAEHKKKVSQLDLPLYRAIKKYGVDSFSIESIEECDNREIDQRENYWIKFYNSCEKGYNCSLGGEGGILYLPEKIIQDIIKRYQSGERLDLICKSYHHDYNAIRKILTERGIQINTHAGPAKLSKRIYAINPINLQVEEIYNSISEAGRALAAEGRNPRAIANHISRYKDTSTISHSYLWKTKIENYENICPECGEPLIWRANWEYPVYECTQCLGTYEKTETGLQRFFFG